MKVYKTFDLFIQAALILLIILIFFLNDSRPNPVDFLIAFALIQVISIIVHLIIGRQQWKMGGLRKIHHTGTLIVLAVLAFAIFEKPEYPNGIANLGLVIYATIPAIALALFYTAITFFEWKKMKETDKNLFPLPK